MRGLRAVGFCGEAVSSADQLETAVKDWLAQPGPALLYIQVNPMQLVMPPFMQVEPAIGMALYSARAILQPRGRCLGNGKGKSLVQARLPRRRHDAQWIAMDQ